jgi:nitrate reductase NapE
VRRPVSERGSELITHSKSGHEFGDRIQPSPSRSRELLVFLFLTVVLAPALAVAIVGGWGFLVWIYQVIYGPPGPPAA